MNKKTKENIKKNVEMLKEWLKLSDKQFEQVFGVTKEIGIKNVLNAIFGRFGKINQFPQF